MVDISPERERYEFLLKTAMTRKLEFAEKEFVRAFEITNPDLRPVTTRQYVMKSYTQLLSDVSEIVGRFHQLWDEGSENETEFSRRIGDYMEFMNEIQERIEKVVDESERETEITQRTTEAYLNTFMDMAREKDDEKGKVVI